MNCDEVRASTEDFVLGSLDGAEWADVVSHLSRCAACRAEAVALTAVVDRLSAMAPAVEPSAGFVERVLDHVGIDPQPEVGTDRRSNLLERVGAAGGRATTPGQADHAGRRRRRRASPAPGRSAGWSPVRATPRPPTPCWYGPCAPRMAFRSGRRWRRRDRRRG